MPGFNGLGNAVVTRSSHCRLLSFVPMSLSFIPFTFGHQFISRGICIAMASLSDLDVRKTTNAVSCKSPWPV